MNQLNELYNIFLTKAVACHFPTGI